MSIDHIMREINKLTTVDVMHFDHGNEMHTHSDHGNDMHTHSEHGNEMQPTVNMYNDILCDENGSGSDIDGIYDVVCNNVLDLNKLEEVLEPCPSDTLYTVDHITGSSKLLLLLHTKAIQYQGIGFAITYNIELPSISSSYSKSESYFFLILVWLDFGGISLFLLISLACSIVISPLSIASLIFISSLSPTYFEIKSLSLTFKSISGAILLQA